MTGTDAASRHVGASACQAAGPGFEVVSYTLVVAPGLVIDKVYCGYWFWGRPSPWQLRADLQDLLRRTKADFDPTTDEARATWMAANTPEPARG